MTTEATMVHVFTNEAGEYFLVPHETIERGRLVTEEQKAQIEQLINESGDVDGYAADRDYLAAQFIRLGTFFIRRGEMAKGIEATTHGALLALGAL